MVNRRQMTEGCSTGLILAKLEKKNNKLKLLFLLRASKFHPISKNLCAA
jgi:hypothetical protein